jgi:3-phosphoshikimate 1-carboxyvinyltransferase
MEAFGVKCRFFTSKDEFTVRIPPQSYNSTEFIVEKDWSAAALVAAALWIKRYPVSAIMQAMPPRDSFQGDRKIIEYLTVLDQAAPGDTVSLDLKDCPDLIAPLTICGIFAFCSCVHLTNIAHTGLKECNRPAVLSRELRRAGFSVNCTEDRLSVIPLKFNNDCSPSGGEPAGHSSASCLQPRPDRYHQEEVILRTSGDHRMAMAFGILSLVFPWISPDNRTCVSKSFPSFWQVRERLAALPSRSVTDSHPHFF